MDGGGKREEQDLRRARCIILDPKAREHPLGDAPRALSLGFSWAPVGSWLSCCRVALLSRQRAAAEAQNFGCQDARVGTRLFTRCSSLSRDARARPIPTLSNALSLRVRVLVSSNAALTPPPKKAASSRAAFTPHVEAISGSNPAHSCTHAFPPFILASRPSLIP